MGKPTGNRDSSVYEVIDPDQEIKGRSVVIAALEGDSGFMRAIGKEGQGTGMADTLKASDPFSIEILNTGFKASEEVYRLLDQAEQEYGLSDPGFMNLPALERHKRISKAYGRFLELLDDQRDLFREKIAAIMTS